MDDGVGKEVATVDFRPRRVAGRYLGDVGVAAALLRGEDGGVEVGELGHVRHGSMYPINNKVETMEVKLTGPELIQAVMIAALRRVENLTVGRKPSYDLTRTHPEWDYDIQGAASEMVVAKTMGYYYSGALGNLKATDAGPYDVRSTGHANGCLILHDRDEDSRIMILAIGKDLDWRLAGWMTAREGKNKKWWKASARPAYFVPQDALYPISDLDKIL